MTRLVDDARGLAAALPTEELDARALTAVKGLVAAAQVDDGQAPVANRHAALRLLPDALVVGASVYQLLRHGGQLLRRQRRARTVPVAKDAAHASCSPCRSGEPRFAA